MVEFLHGKVFTWGRFALGMSRGEVWDCYSV